MNIQSLKRIGEKRFWILITLAILIMVPTLLSSYYVYLLNMVFIFFILGMGLDLTMGYTGLISLGHAGFFAIGAYTSALLITRFGLSYWIALPIAGIFTAFIGFFIGLISLRIRGHYLAMVTLGFTQIVQLILIHVRSVTRGPDGIFLPKITIGTFVLSTDLRFYYVILGFGLLLYVIAKNIIDSRMGRAFVSIRDNELASEAMGVDAFIYKTNAFALGSFYAGIAGSFYAGYVGYISPEAFTILISINALMIILFGGIGTLVGSFYGAALVIVAPELMRYFKGLEIYQGLFFGIILLFVIIFMPNGVHGFVLRQLSKLKSEYKRKRGRDGNLELFQN